MMLSFWVDPGGTSREYNFGDLYKDYNASLNMLVTASGQGLPEVKPVEMELYPDLSRGNFRRGSKKPHAKREVVHLIFNELLE